MNGAVHKSRHPQNRGNPISAKRQGEIPAELKSEHVGGFSGVTGFRRAGEGGSKSRMRGYALYFLPLRRLRRHLSRRARLYLLIPIYISGLKRLKTYSTSRLPLRGSCRAVTEGAFTCEAYFTFHSSLKSYSPTTTLLPPYNAKSLRYGYLSYAMLFT